MIKTATGYSGTLRRQRILPLVTPRYPEVENTLVYLTFTPDFLLVSVVELADETKHRKHINYTRGPEDVRLVTENCGLAVSLDTTPNFRIEVALLDCTSKAIIAVRPLRYSEAKSVEKNWIFLRALDEQRWHVLYSTNPIKVLEVNTSTLECTTFRESKSQLWNHPTHCGAAVQLPNGSFLIAVRCKKGHSYLHSRFMLLDATYSVVSYTVPFRFLYDAEHSTSDGQYKCGPYEMCMSLWIEENSLFATVSVNDASTYILEYSLEAIVKKLIQSPHMLD